jgi:SAM-dependent methyltransferase
MNRLSHEELMEYWISESLHKDYVDGEKRSDIVVRLVNEAWPDKSISILEPGCNIGRNLHFLIEAGYTNLSGIEVSPRVMEPMRDAFPDVPKTTTLHLGTIEDHIVGFEDGEFDVIFTMAVLEHIHPDSEWVFEQLVRVARFGIVTIEDEVNSNSHRIWPRNYKDVFEELGMTEDLSRNCADYPLDENDFGKQPKRFWARRFRK